MSDLGVDPSNVVPSPGSFSTRTTPPLSVTMPHTMGSPSPVPRGAA
jgi:hypothetical protein